MKLQKLFVIPALVAVLSLPFSAYAAKGDRKKAQGPDFATLDKDSNGSINQAEYVAGMKDKPGKDGAILNDESAAKQFKDLDTNKDGKLTTEEFAVGQPAKKKGKRNR